MRALRAGSIAALLLVTAATVGAQERVRGRVTVGALQNESGSGVFDPNIVVRQIRARLRAMQVCYERQLRNDPTLAGEIVVRFTLDEQGLIGDVSAIRNTTGSDAVAACATDTIRRFRFSPGAEGGPVTFEFPFTFAKVD